MGNVSASGTSGNANIVLYPLNGSDINFQDPTGTDVFYVRNVVATQTTADGHVSTWYDQSGNTKHATQGTPASQPKVVDAGVFLGEILFDGVDDYIDIAGLTTLSNPFTFFQVVDLDGGAAFRPATDGITGSNSRVITGNGLGSSENDSMYAGLYLQNTPVVTDLALRSYFFKGDSSSSYFRNGSQGFVGDVGAQKPSSGIRIAADHDLSGDHSNIRFKEFIVYDSDQAANRTAFEANIGEVYGIAGIPAYDNTVNGFVETWYDQSGNGNDAVQATASQQPKIVEGGVLVERTVNGVSSPSVKYTAGNLMTHGLTSLSADGQQSLFFVSDNQLTSSTSTRLIEIMSNSVDDARRRRPLIYRGNGGNFRFSVDTLAGLYRTSSQSNFVSLYSSITEESGGGTHTAYQDGSQFGSASVTLDVNPNIDLNSRQFGNIAPDELGAFFFTEVIYYPSDQSANRPAIEDNIDNHYGITPAFSPEATNYFSRLDAAGDTTYVDYKQPLANYIDSLVSLGGAYWDDMLTSASFVGVGIQGITVPLRDGMTALTNNNFVAGDLNQLTGLKSDGSTKYLDTGYIDSDLAQNNGSLSVYVDTPSSINGTFYAGTTSAGNTGTFLRRRVTNPQLNVHGFLVDVGTAIIDGLVGVSRTSSTSVNARTNQTNYSFTDTSTTPTSDALQIFARQSTSISDPRLATYHAGPALDLATLEGLQERLLSEVAAVEAAAGR